MSSSRSSFLQRVRQAVQEGNRAGHSPELPSRCGLGYQGAGPDPIATLQREVTAAGACLQVVASEQEVVSVVLHIVGQRGPARVLLGSGGRLARLPLRAVLEQAGVAVDSVDDLSAAEAKERFFSASVGISGVDALIAETGTLALASGPQQPRSLSLLPPLHIAIVWRDDLVADLFDLFEQKMQPDNLPACWSLITGPSKTGDIELKLVTGVHGPGEVLILLIDAAASVAK